jgi:hypothetical protein
VAKRKLSEKEKEELEFPDEVSRMPYPHTHSLADRRLILSCVCGFRSAAGRHAGGCACEAALRPVPRPQELPYQPVGPQGVPPEVGQGPHVTAECSFALLYGGG